MRVKPITDNNLLIKLLTPEIKQLHLYSGKELAVTMLKVIALSGTIATIFVVPNSAQLFSLFEPRNNQEKRRLQNTYANLKRLDQIGESDSGLILKEKGKQRTQEIAYSNISLRSDGNWDGYWRVVMYDIPNTKKVKRQLLQEKLRSVGCRQIQKSVYVYPYPCHREISIIAQQLDVSKHLEYVLAVTLPNEDLLQKGFGVQANQSEAAVKSKPRL